jgi:hypothetical protein
LHSHWNRCSRLLNRHWALASQSDRALHPSDSRENNKKSQLSGGQCYIFLNGESSSRTDGSAEDTVASVAVITNADGFESLVIVDTHGVWSAAADIATRTRRRLGRNHWQANLAGALETVAYVAVITLADVLLLLFIRTSSSRVANR